MPTVKEFFAREAGDYLDRLENVVGGLDEGAVAPAELHRMARALRGSAQLARDEGFARIAAALEGVGRGLAGGYSHWTADLSARVRETVAGLRALLAGEPAAPGFVDDTVARLAGAATPAGPAGAGGDGSEPPFRGFAARETAGIVATLDTAIRALERDARDREALKAVLRRQRALMGAARLPQLPLLAETLATLDEITRLIARLDIAVRDEWLEVYREAREVLTPLAGVIQSGEEPVAGPALLRLRTLRQGLLERHGGEEPPASRPPAPEPRPEPTADQALPIDEFLYRGESALRRARELRPALERTMAEGGTEARALLAELFDLIELARA